MNTARLHAAVFEPIEKVLDGFPRLAKIRTTERNATTTRRYSTMQTTDPHQAEYLAAAAGIHEQTPRTSRTQEPAVGDFISGCTDGRRWSGHVEWVERGFVCVNVGGGWVSVPTYDITH